MNLANIKSAKKRVKVANAKNLQNRMVKSSLKTAVKRFNAATATGEKETAQALFNRTASIVDKAAAKGVIHKNAANRKKAQLSVALAKVQ